MFASLRDEDLRRVEASLVSSMMTVVDMGSEAFLSPDGKSVPPVQAFLLKRMFLRQVAEELASRGLATQSLTTDLLMGG